MEDDISAGAAVDFYASSSACHQPEHYMPSLWDGLSNSAHVLPERYIPGRLQLDDPVDEQEWQSSPAAVLDASMNRTQYIWAHQRAGKYWNKKFLRLRYPFLYLFPSDRLGVTAERCVFLKGATISAQEVSGRLYLWLRQNLPMDPFSTFGEVLILRFDNSLVCETLATDMDDLLEPPLFQSIGLSDDDIEGLLSILNWDEGMKEVLHQLSSGKQGLSAFFTTLLGITHDATHLLDSKDLPPPQAISERSLGSSNEDLDADGNDAVSDSEGRLDHASESQKAAPPAKPCPKKPWKPFHRPPLYTGPGMRAPQHPPLQSLQNAWARFPLGDKNRYGRLTVRVVQAMGMQADMQLKPEDKVWAQVKFFEVSQKTKLVPWDSTKPSVWNEEFEFTVTLRSHSPGVVGASWIMSDPLEVGLWAGTHEYMPRLLGCAMINLTYLQTNLPLNTAVVINEQDLQLILEFNAVDFGLPPAPISGNSGAEQIGPMQPAADLGTLRVKLLQAVLTCSKKPSEMRTFVRLQVSGQQHLSSVVEGTFRPVWEEEFIFYVPIARRQDKEAVYHDILGDMVLRIELWNDNQGLGGGEIELVDLMERMVETILVPLPTGGNLYLEIESMDFGIPGNPSSPSAGASPLASAGAPSTSPTGSLGVTPARPFPQSGSPSPAPNDSPKSSTSSPEVSPRISPHSSAEGANAAKPPAHPLSPRHGTKPCSPLRSPLCSPAKMLKWGDIISTVSQGSTISPSNASQCSSSSSTSPPVSPAPIHPKIEPHSGLQAFHDGRNVDKKDRQRPFPLSFDLSPPVPSSRSIGTSPRGNPGNYAAQATTSGSFLCMTELFPGLLDGPCTANMTLGHQHPILQQPEDISIDNSSGTLVIHVVGIALSSLSITDLELQMTVAGETKTIPLRVANDEDSGKAENGTNFSVPVVCSSSGTVRISNLTLQAELISKGPSEQRCIRQASLRALFLKMGVPHVVHLTLPEADSIHLELLAVDFGRTPELPDIWNGCQLDKFWEAALHINLEKKLRKALSIDMSQMESTIRELREEITQKDKDLHDRQNVVDLLQEQLHAREAEIAKLVARTADQEQSVISTQTSAREEVQRIRMFYDERLQQMEEIIDNIPTMRSTTSQEGGRGDSAGSMDIKLSQDADTAAATQLSAAQSYKLLEEQELSYELLIADQRHRMEFAISKQQALEQKLRRMDELLVTAQTRLTGLHDLLLATRPAAGTVHRVGSSLDAKAPARKKHWSTDLRMLGKLVDELRAECCSSPKVSPSAGSPTKSPASLRAGNKASASTSQFPASAEEPNVDGRWVESSSLVPLDAGESQQRQGQLIAQVTAAERRAIAAEARVAQLQQEMAARDQQYQKQVQEGIQWALESEQRLSHVRADLASVEDRLRLALEDRANAEQQVALLQLQLRLPVLCKQCGGDEAPRSSLQDDLLRPAAESRQTEFWRTKCDSVSQRLAEVVLELEETKKQLKASHEPPTKPTSSRGVKVRKVSSTEQPRLSAGGDRTHGASASPSSASVDPPKRLALRAKPKPLSSSTRVDPVKSHSSANGVLARSTTASSSSSQHVQSHVHDAPRTRLSLSKPGPTTRSK